MKKLIAKCLGVTVSILLLLVLSVATYAATYNYDNTTPTFGTKTVCTGVIDIDCSEGYRNATYNCESYFIGWVEAKIDGTWVKISDEKTFYANQDIIKAYNVHPLRGTEMRFVIKKAGLLGGDRVVGMITFSRISVED